MSTTEDINKVRHAISMNEGVVACQINSEKKDISVVYDDYFVTEERLIQSIENLGYVVF